MVDLCGTLYSKRWHLILPPEAAACRADANCCTDASCQGGRKKTNVRNDGGEDGGRGTEDGGRRLLLARLAAGREADGWLITWICCQASAAGRKWAPGTEKRFPCLR